MNDIFRFTPENASTFASDVDQLMLFLVIICGLVLVGVAGLILFFCVRYRPNSLVNRKMPPENTQSRLEWTWTLASTFIFLGIFIWGSTVYFGQHRPPPDASTVFLVGRQWMWKFQYPNGVREINNLHVPVGKPIQLVMTSQDVIHSIFIPAFRVKQDVLPGRYTYTWFQATKAGVYRIYCTQYCGTAHADMGGYVTVMEPEDYERWLSTGLEKGGAVKNGSVHGAELFQKFGCVACHGVGSSIHAPDLAGIYGKYQPLTDGTQVLADDSYLRESILNPNAKIVYGYQAIMPPFDGRLSEEDVIDLISYLRSLHPGEKIYQRMSHD